MHSNWLFYFLTNHWKQAWISYADPSNFVSHNAKVILLRIISFIYPFCKASSGLVNWSLILLESQCKKLSRCTGYFFIFLHIFESKLSDVPENKKAPFRRFLHLSRRRRDSNPRNSFPFACLANMSFRPLRHLSNTIIKIECVNVTIYFKIYKSSIKKYFFSHDFVHLVPWSFYVTLA